MSLTWRGVPEPELARPDAIGQARAILRGILLLLVLLCGLIVMGAVRIVERTLRPGGQLVSPWVTVLVCRAVLSLLRLRASVNGRPMAGPGAMVANHSSWLDIFVLNSRAPMVFVAKSDVSGWPGIGLLARATGTLFIRREARGEAARQAEAVANRLRTGPILMFFPEGTSTDNHRVLPFKTALFAGLLSPGLAEGLMVQPVTIAYEAPPGADPRFLAWWGETEFAPHALAVLSAPAAGKVRLTFHPPIPVAGRDRKTLAAEAEAAVRSALPGRPTGSDHRRVERPYASRGIPGPPDL